MEADKIWTGIEGVIFDMDGLLVDTEPLHYMASNVVLARFQRHLEWEDNKRFIGLGELRYWTILKEEMGLPDSVQALTSERSAAFLRLLEEKGVEKRPGAEDLLRICRERYPVGLASSTPPHQIDAILAKAGLIGMLPIRISGENPYVKHGKPAPDIYLYTASLLGVDPGRCLVFEDSLTGTRAAKAAGMRCVSVPHGQTVGMDFSIADLVVEDLTRVLPSIQ